MAKPIISGPYRTFRRLNDYESFVEFEGSTITVPMKARRSADEQWIEDEIKLKAFMRLEVFPAYLNNLGTREFQFIIRDWDLYGKSPMLNELFFDDPRGHWTRDQSGAEDYVPAVVTFNVANHYDAGVDSDDRLSPHEIFGSTRELEIRNLSSHHTRVWAELPERSARWTYTLPFNRIYWQLWPAGRVKSKDGKGAKAESPTLIFHKKPPRIGVNAQRFDPREEQDVSRYMLGVAKMQEGGDRIRFVANLDRRGFRANQVQMPGNAVLSSLYLQRHPLEVRWSFNPRIRDMETLNRMISETKKEDGSLSGWIQIASPSRSLGTADQAPDVGHPHDSTDFPARITYAINYNIHLNRERFVEDQAGIAIAAGALEIPPRDVTVAFDKPHIGHVLRRFLEFGPGHCTGMHEIPEHEYQTGLNYCRYWRGVPLDPDDGDWPNFQDFDPDIEY